MTDPLISPDEGNHRREEDRLAIIELRARLAKMEVELVDARRLSVDEIYSKKGPFSFFDRHGMMGLLFAVFVQTAGVIWWASTITGKVNELQTAFQRAEQTQTIMAQNIAANADRLTRVQTVQENVVKILDHTIQRVYRDDRTHAVEPGGQPRGPLIPPRTDQ